MATEWWWWWCLYFRMWPQNSICFRFLISQRNLVGPWGIYHQLQSPYSTRKNLQAAYVFRADARRKLVLVPVGWNRLTTENALMGLTERSRGPCSMDGCFQPSPKQDNKFLFIRAENSWIIKLIHCQSWNLSWSRPLIFSTSNENTHVFSFSVINKSSKLYEESKVQ